MKIENRNRIQEKEQKATLKIIKMFGFDTALEKGYQKALYLVANSSSSTLALEWLDWSFILLRKSREDITPQRAAELRMLSQFYRVLSHKLYWFLRQDGKTEKNNDFIRSLQI